ncbi:hypothetical protein IEQ34_003604 [Dendrobium chrysotoxum]|uniref:protein-serine/threonine phosphatase n=1 Tax=Dendrobium chrysotoxum TaxID=161865 RepID=A0AAV7HHP2_DENCH|nr:hypothetical protein IEQ34_003604 [Dendrobium chrysotoxum]
MDETAVDALIARLLDAKNGRTVRQVHMTELEIRQLCLAAKEVFLSQPNLLELEAPIKICGKQLRNVIVGQNETMVGELALDKAAAAGVPSRRPFKIFNDITPRNDYGLTNKISSYGDEVNIVGLQGIDIVRIKVTILSWDIRTVMLLSAFPIELPSLSSLDSISRKLRLLSATKVDDNELGSAMKF